MTLVVDPKMAPDHMIPNIETSLTLFMMALTGTGLAILEHMALTLSAGTAMQHARGRALSRSCLVPAVSGSTCIN